MSRAARRRLLGRDDSIYAKGWCEMQEMKWIFLAYSLFIIATILRYLPLGRWGLTLRLGNAAYGMSFNLIAFWLLLVVGSSIILVQVVGSIINVIANARVVRPHQAVEEKARLL